jgi:hypothetical protein
MFYGSMDRETAIAEVLAAKPEPQPMISTAEFEALRPLVLLNLVDIPPMPSIFDEYWRHLRGPVSFLGDFSVEIAGPVSVDEDEHLEYVPTQVVTEYVRHMLPTRHGQPADGLITCPLERQAA